MLNFFIISLKTRDTYEKKISPNFFTIPAIILRNNVDLRHTSRRIDGKQVQPI